MIDDLFPAGVPDGLVQIGNVWFVGCAECGKAVAVAYQYPGADVPLQRQGAFMDLVAALSGHLVHEFDGRSVAGVILTPHRDAGHVAMTIVYPVGRLPRTRGTPEADVVAVVRGIGVLATNHECGPRHQAA